MKLFLTSEGLTNNSIRQAFCELLPDTPDNCSVAVIPTAANVCSDISWLEEHLENIQKAGITKIERLDLETLPIDSVLERLYESDVIWFEGGNTYHLLHWVRASGLAEALPELLENKIYAGVSAGSMIAGPSVESNSPMFPEEDQHKIENLNGLGLVPFAVIPHLNSDYFKHTKNEFIKLFADTVDYPVYALDDNSAIEVVGGSLRIITEGDYLEYNK